MQQENEKYIDSRFYPILKRKHKNFSDDELKRKLEFEQELGLFDNMKEIQDELLQETKNITISLHTKQAAEKYFKNIEAQIEKRARYKNNKNKLNYKLMRRFLWTAFNNLYELDLSIITTEIMQLSNNLREMAKVYNDFSRKIKYPSLAYDEVFLAKQSEYTNLKKNTEKIINEIKQLKVSENYLADLLKKKKNNLEKSLKTPQYPQLLQEYKRLNGTYADTVYICSVLREKLLEDKTQIQTFEKRYASEFNTFFQTTAAVYEKAFTDILGAMAFELDRLLWEQAKKSPQVAALFEEAHINGEYNSKIYLKYYLDNTDIDKASDERQELQELYEYLESLYIESILIVTNNIDDAIEYKKSVKLLNKEQDVVSFTDEKLALKWAFQNNVKVLVLHVELQNMTLDCFLRYYQKYSLAESDIILLGTAQKLPCPISKTLPSGTVPHSLSKHVKELLSKP